MIPTTFGVFVEVVDGKVIVGLPKFCSDITLDWNSLFILADAIGSLAFDMPDHMSDPGQDEAEADFVRIGRTAGRLTVVYFRQKIEQLRFTKNVAMIVAEKMAKVSELIAGEVEAGKV